MYRLHRRLRHRHRAETPRQIANAHTFFNVANTLIFTWFTSRLARLVQWLVPERPLDDRVIIVRPRFLHEGLWRAPSLAPDQMRMEIMPMGETVNSILQGIMPAINKAVAAAVQAVGLRNQRAAQVVIGMKEEISRIADSAAAHEAR